PRPGAAHARVQLPYAHAGRQHAPDLARTAHLRCRVVLGVPHQLLHVALLLPHLLGRVPRARERASARKPLGHDAAALDPGGALADRPRARPAAIVGARDRASALDLGALHRRRLLPSPRRCPGGILAVSRVRHRPDRRMGGLGLLVRAVLQARSRRRRAAHRPHPRPAPRSREQTLRRRALRLPHRPALLGARARALPPRRCHPHRRPLRQRHSRVDRLGGRDGAQVPERRRAAVPGGHRARRGGLALRLPGEGLMAFIESFLLTTFLGPIVVLSSWNFIQERVNVYCIALLLLETAILGTLASLDLVLFYVFWEAMLIPMYLLIGMWGSDRRIYAAVKFFLF